MNVVETRLFNLFRRELKLTDESAAAFVEAVEDVMEYERREEKNAFSTKEDISKLELKLDLIREENRKLELKIREDIHKLELKISDTRSDIYRAVFLSGLLQFLGILGGVIAIVKFMK
jgi:septal ring factor EnvC (AmiA/AmiB activator)